MFMDIISMTNNLWFNGKMSWEDKEKFNSYAFKNADDEQLMEKLYKKMSYYQDNMSKIPKNGIRY